MYEIGGFIWNVKVLFKLYDYKIYSRFIPNNVKTTITNNML